MIRRGAIVAAMLMLIVLTLAVGVVVLAGADDQQLAAQRVQGLRSRYAVDSAAGVAIKELKSNLDVDGDGVVGTVSDDGASATDPAVAGTRFWVGKSTVSGTTTISAHASNADADRAIILTASGGGTSATALTLAYADSSAASAPKARTWESAGWSAAATLASLSTSLYHTDVSQSPLGETAAMAIDASRAVALATRANATSAWTSVGTMTTNCGTAYSPAATIGYEQSSGDLLVVYRVSTNTAPRFRARVGGVMSAESTVSMGLSSPPEQLMLIPRGGTDTVLLLARSGATIAASFWNGTAFGAATTLTTSANTLGEPLAGAFETASGDALVVWGSGSTVVRRSSIGGTWQSEASVASAGSTVHVVSLAANPVGTSNDIMLGYSSRLGALTVQRWDGSAVGLPLAAETSLGPAGLERGFDLAYCLDGSRASLVWFRPTALRTILMRNWSGASWSLASTAATLSHDAAVVRLSPSQSSSEVIAAVQTRPAVANINNYTLYTESVFSPGTTTYLGTAGANVAGIDLPSPPSATHGSLNQSYGNNVTVSIAPGSYGDYSFGNSCTANLTAGTYRFKTFGTDKNSFRLRADTSAGDVVFILANGNFQALNDLTIETTGGGMVWLHVLNGNVDLKNNATISRARVYVYNGNIDIGHNLSAVGTFWASGNINLSGGVVYPDSLQPGTTARLVTFPITGGVAGSVSTQSTGLFASPLLRSFDLAAPPRAGGVALASWNDVAP